MKKKLNLITAIFLTSAALNFSSCLKDNSHYIDFAGSAPTVELPLTAPGAVSNGPFFSEAYTISPTPVLLPLIVNLASPNTLKTAVTVTLAVDTADLNAYNTANGTNYTVLPDTDYSVSGLTLTIPAGQREVPLNITIKTASIDPSGSFVLPLKIVSSSVTINQFNYILYNIGVKNIYDGEYTVTGTLNDVANSSITGDYPSDVYLITKSATSNAYFDNTGGAYEHLINVSGSVNAFGSFAPKFIFSSIPGTITDVTNYYGQDSGSHGRSAVLDPTGQNKIISGVPGKAGFVFQVSYIMQQADYAGTNAVYFNETFTYVGPRP